MDNAPTLTHPIQSWLEFWWSISFTRVAPSRFWKKQNQLLRFGLTFFGLERNNRMFPSAHDEVWKFRQSTIIFTFCPFAGSAPTIILRPSVQVVWVFSNRGAPILVVSYFPLKPPPPRGCGASKKHSPQVHAKIWSRSAGVP